MIKNNLNVLTEIKKLMEVLEDIKDTTKENDTLNNVINELSIIIQDNADKQEFKNIGIKVSKFNIEKYIKAKNNIDNVVKLFPKIKIDGQDLNIIKFNSMQSIRIDEEIQENIEHRINSYNIALEKNKKI